MSTTEKWFHNLFIMIDILPCTGRSFVMFVLTIHDSPFALMSTYYASITKYVFLVIFVGKFPECYSGNLYTISSQCG